MTKEEFAEVYRHSLAHILAKAVIEIYGKEVQYAIGPQIEDGCYYDFVLPKAVTQDDFNTIEDKMREIIKVHFGNVDQKLVNEALKAFYDIRSMRDIQKKPSTSELLDWIQALQIAGCDVNRIVNEIPYIGVLLKKNQDVDTARAYTFRR